MDRDPIVSLRFGTRDGDVRNLFLFELLGSLARAVLIMNEEPRVGARPGPLRPEILVAREVEAIEAPTLFDMTGVAVLAHRQLAHRQSAARMAGEDEIAELRTPALIRAMRSQRSQRLVNVPV